MKFVPAYENEYTDIRENRSDKVFIILYHKDNCPHCDDAKPKIEHYLTEQGYTEDQIKMVSIHTDTLGLDDIQKRNLRAAPTLHIFQNGEFLGGIQGGLGTTPYSYLDSELGKILKGRT